MTPRDTIRTGRLVAGRSDSSKARCPGCDARLLYGEPRSNSTWYERLRLEPDTADLLLLAAADFSEISTEAGEPEDAVAFIDWVTGVTRLTHFQGPEADGASPVSEAGGPGHPTSQQRHPFPLPLAELPSKWRKVG